MTAKSMTRHHPRWRLAWISADRTFRTPHLPDGARVSLAQGGPVVSDIRNTSGEGLASLRFRQLPSK